jgi:hypothetical protein
MAGVGPALGAVTQGVQLMTEAFARSARAADAANNSFLSTEQRLRGIAESIPVVGSLIREINNLGLALSGAADRIRQAHVSLLAGLAGDVERFRLRSLIAPHAAEAGLQAARARSIGSLGPVEVGATARATAAERVLYGEELQRQGARDAVRMARAEAVASRDALRSLEERQARLQVGLGAGGGLSRGRYQAAFESGDTSFAGQAGLVEAAGGQVRGLTNELHRQRELEQSIAATGQQRVEAAQREATLRRSILEAEQTELNILVQREREAMSTEERVGRLRPYQVDASLASAERVQQTGWRAASFFDRAQAARLLGPQWEAAQAGAAGREMIAERRGQLEQVSGGMRFDLSTELAPQTDEARRRVRQGRQDVEGELAGSLQAAADRIVNTFVSMIEGAVRRAEERVQAGFQLANANR